MTEFEVTQVVIQGLFALIFTGGAWYGQRHIARVDALEKSSATQAEVDALEARTEAQSTRLGALESKQAVFDVRLQSAAATEEIRAVMREELDRALEPIKQEQDRMSRRIARLEERTD